MPPKPNRRAAYSPPILLVLAACIFVSHSAPAQEPDSFHFALLGDRTGEAQPGVYPRVWSEMAAEDPAFVVGVGDTIQGMNDAALESEWGEVDRMLAPYRGLRRYLAPGNHDIWSAAAESGFQKHTGHAPHYSFNYASAHFTVLDNSRLDELSAAEMAFLKQDLEANKTRPVKFIVSHRPSWLIDALSANTNSPLQQLAKRYGVQYIVAGHLHRLMHVELDGVTYFSVGSSGGHLRGSEKYEDGWFFGFTRVDVRGQNVSFRIEELKSPFGQGRVTNLNDWGGSGLVRKNAASPGR